MPHILMELMEQMVELQVLKSQPVVVEPEAEAGGGYNYGGSGGTGGAAGNNHNAESGGGGRGGQSYYTQTATNHGYSIPTHTRTSGSNGQIMITFLGE